jgi:hypothetical protein
MVRMQTALESEVEWCLKSLGCRIEWTEMQQVADRPAEYLSPPVNFLEADF